MFSLRTRLITFLTLLACFAAGMVQRALAEDVSGTLPAVFIPVTGSGWITDGAQVVIGAESKSEGIFHMAEAALSGSFIAAQPSTGSTPTTITVDDAPLVWTLEAATGGYRLKNNGNYVAKGKSATALKFSATASEAIVWRISEAEGAFRLTDTKDSERYFALSLTTEGPTPHYIFGKYKNSGGCTVDLRLYRYERATLHLGGAAVMPADGTIVTLLADGLTPTAEGVTPTADYLLCNGHVAASVPAQRWRAKVRNANTLALLFPDGRYLDAGLQPTSTETWWTLAEGALWQEDRVLRYLPSQSRFATLTVDEAAIAPGEAVAFLPVADEAQVALADGVLIVSGGLSAAELAELDWQGAWLLDLTAASLPLNPQPFTNRPAANNNVVLVSEATARFVPHEWDFAVSKGTIYTLLTRAALTDRQPLRLPADIVVNSAQVTYTRTLCGDGGWETLCLPFDTDLPTGFEAETLTETDEENAVFAPATSLPAGQGVLFRPTDSHTTEVTFVAKGGTLTTRTEGAFRGVYDSLVVTTSSPEQPYLLHADGTRFVRPAAGSTLAPFRAALHTNGTRQVRHKVTPQNL